MAINKGILFSLILIMAMTHSPLYGGESIGYTGRLVNSDGKPLTGSVDLKFELFYSDDLGNVLAWERIDGVGLSNGVYVVELDFDTAGNFPGVYTSLRQIMDNIPSGKVLLIRTHDITNSLSFDYQSILSVPMAFQAANAKSAQTVANGAIAPAQMNFSGVCADGMVISKTGTTFTCVDPGGAGTVKSVSAAAGSQISIGGSATDPVIDLSAGAAGAFLRTDGSGNVVWSMFGNCPAGSSIRAIDAAGNVTCEADDNTSLAAGNGIDTLSLASGTINISVAAGSGLGFTSGALDLDASLIQKRVSNACSSGEFITGINADGTVACSSNWTKNGSDLYYTGGLVGVGTSTPDTALDVQGASTNSLPLRVFRNNGSVSAGVGIDFAAKNSAGSEVSYGNFYVVPGDVTPGAESGAFRFYNMINGAMVPTMSISSTGNVGVNTLTPYGRFSVVSDQSERVIISGSPSDTNAIGPKISLFGSHSATTITGPSLQAITNGGWGRHRLGIFQHNADDYSHEEEVVSILPNGNVGIGSTTAPNKLYVLDEITNSASIDNSGIYAGTRHVVDTSGGYSSRAAYFANSTKVDSGVSASGNQVGVLSQALRNLGTTGDDGSLSNLIASNVGYGHHNSDMAAMPETTNAYGVRITPYSRTGTLHNAYDLYLGAPLAVTGVINNHYGIYQAHAGAKNFFSGNVGLGVLAPTERLEVDGNIKVSAGNDFCIDGGACLSTIAGGSGEVNTASSAGGKSIFKGKSSADLVFKGLTSTTDITLIENVNDIGIGINTSNGANELVRLDGTGKLPALDGSQLTGINLVVNSSAGAETTQAPSVDAMKSYVQTEVGAINESQWDNVTGGINYAGGYVGIGTTSPESAFQIANPDEAFKVGKTSDAYHSTLTGNQLNFNRVGPSYIRQSVVGGSLRFQTSEAGTHDVDAMQIMSNGNVGIGVLAPQTKFEVSNTSTNAIRGVMSSQHNDGLQAPFFTTKKSRGSASAPTGIQNGDYISGFQGLGYHSENDYGTPKYSMLQKASEAWTSSAQGSELTFFTTLNGLTANSERMVIKNDGKIGIGTSDPSTLLHVKNTSTAAVTIEGMGAASNAQINMVSGTETASIIQNQTTNIFGLRNAPSGNVHLAIDQAGNVGIGTDLPEGKLDVQRVETGPSYVDGPIARFSNLYNSGGNGHILDIIGVGDGSGGYKHINLRTFHGDLSFGAKPDGLYGEMKPSPDLYINSFGNVGIGTNTPLGKFHIYGDDANWIDRAGFASHLVLRGSKGTMGAETALMKDDIFGMLSFTGHDGSAYSTNAYVGITAQATEDWSPTNKGSRLFFRTTKNGSVTEGTRMVIEENGNVGIGTSIPTEKLHVSASAPVMVLQDSDSLETDDSFSGWISGKDSSGLETWWVGEGSAAAKIVGLVASRPDYLVKIGNTAKTITIAADGNVGIGTTTPNDALDVVGDVDATGCFQTGDSTNVGGVCVSDRRLKYNIQPLAGSLEKMLKLRPVTYVWRPEFIGVHGREGEELGLIAQEVEAVLPELVLEKDDGFKRVKYDISLDLHIIQAIKEFFGMFEERSSEVDRKIASLEQENRALKDENKAIKNFLCQQHPEADFCAR